MPVEGSGLLVIEGALQLIIAVVAVATIYWRGKNPYLSILAICFAFIGVLGVFPEILTETSALFGVSAGNIFVHIISHVSTYFGVAIYITFILVMLRGPRIFVKSAATTLVIASVFAIIHLLHTELFRFNPENKLLVNRLADMADVLFFIIANTAGAVLLGLVLFKVRKNKPGIYGYSVTVCVGISLMISALLIFKSVDIIPNNEYHFFLSAIAVIMGFVGLVAQISLIAQPGMVFNSTTREPVALATVRVFDENNKIVETCATGQNGRYVVLLNPGTYKIAVIMAGYKFPTGNNVGYKGEAIKVLRPKILSLDIALDPAV